MRKKISTHIRVSTRKILNPNIKYIDIEILKSVL